MTPAEIGAKLTPAQVQALRDPNGRFGGDWFYIVYMDKQTGRRSAIELFDAMRVDDGCLTAIGRAVLAELDKMR